MDIKTLTAGLSVSPQIEASNMRAIKNAGFRAIICNRPDGEGRDQPTFDEISKAAAKPAGYDVAGVVRRIVNGGKTPTDTGDASYDVVIVGAGSGSIALIPNRCRVVKYKRLIVCPQIKLDWNAIDALVDTLDQNGVPSN